MGNNMMSLTMGNLKFLDVKHFVAPGFPYAKYLKAFNVEENKSFSRMNTLLILVF